MIAIYQAINNYLSQSKVPATLVLKIGGDVKEEDMTAIGFVYNDGYWIIGRLQAEQALKSYLGVFDWKTHWQAESKFRLGQLKKRVNA